MSTANASVPGNVRPATAQDRPVPGTDPSTGPHHRPGSLRTPADPLAPRANGHAGLLGVHHIGPGGPLTLRDHLNDVRPLTRWEGELVVVLPDDPVARFGSPTACCPVERARRLMACGLGPRAHLVPRSALDGHALLEGLLGEVIGSRTAVPRVAADLLLLRADLLLVACAGEPGGGDRIADGPRHAPVGDLTAAGTLARRFNDRHPPVFPLPELLPLDRTAPGTVNAVPFGGLPVDPPGGGVGSIGLLDSPTRIAAAVRATRTDLNPRLSYDPDLRRGVSHLAGVLGALTDRPPGAVLAGIRGTGALKARVTQAVVETLRPIRQRYRQLQDDPAPVHARLAEGEAAVGGLVARTLDAVRAAVA